MFFLWFFGLRCVLTAALCRRKYRGEIRRPAGRGAAGALGREAGGRGAVGSQGDKLVLCVRGATIASDLYTTSLLRVLCCPLLICCFVVVFVFESSSPSSSSLAAPRSLLILCDSFGVI